jgi:hypothetical protein
MIVNIHCFVCRVSVQVELCQLVVECGVVIGVIEIEVDGKFMYFWHSYCNDCRSASDILLQQ